MRIKIILAAVALILLLSIVFLVIRLKDKNNTISQLKTSNKSLITRIDTFRNEKNQVVVEKVQVIVDKKEVERLNSTVNKYKQELELLGIKLRSTEYVMEMQYSTMGIMIAQMDTMRKETPTPDIKYFTDGYYTCLYSNNLLKCNYTDTMISAISRFKDAKWFLPKLWKPWSYKLDAKFSNPNSTIHYSQFIKLD